MSPHLSIPYLYKPIVNKQRVSFCYSYTPTKQTMTKKPDRNNTWKINLRRFHQKKRFRSTAITSHDAWHMWWYVYALESAQPYSFILWAAAACPDLISIGNKSLACGKYTNMNKILYTVPRRIYTNQFITKICVVTDCGAAAVSVLSRSILVHCASENIEAAYTQSIHPNILIFKCAILMDYTRVLCYCSLMVKYMRMLRNVWASIQHMVVIVICVRDRVHFERFHDNGKGYNRKRDSR